MKTIIKATAKTATTKALKININLNSKSLLLDADRNQRINASNKTAIALQALIKGEVASIKTACALYGIPADKKNSLYETAKGFHKDYLKAFESAAKYLPKELKEQIAALAVSRTKLHDAMMALDFGTGNTAPASRVQWVDFINGFIPADKDEDKVTKLKPTANAKTPSAGGREKGKQQTSSSAAQLVANEKGGSKVSAEVEMKAEAKRISEKAASFGAKLKAAKLGLTAEQTLKVINLYKAELSA